ADAHSLHDALPISSARSGTLSAGGQTFTVNQSGAPCTYTLSAPSASFTSSGGLGSVNVTAGSGCSWTAASGVAWITTTSSGSGSGTVNYSVAANTGTSARSGTLSAGGQTFTVNQSGAPCTYTLSAPSASFTSSGGNGSVNVTAGRGWRLSAARGAAGVTTTSRGRGSSREQHAVAADTC